MWLDTWYGNDKLKGQKWWSTENQPLSALELDHTPVSLKNTSPVLKPIRMNILITIKFAAINLILWIFHFIAKIHLPQWTCFQKMAGFYATICSTCLSPAASLQLQCTDDAASHCLNLILYFSFWRLRHTRKQNCITVYQSLATNW